MSHILENDIFICTIRKLSLDYAGSCRTGKVHNNLHILRRIHEVGGKVL